MIRRTVEDLQILGEVIAVVIATWLVLGHHFGEPITMVDGAMFWQPYIRSLLGADGVWTEHLYRFGVIGGNTMHPYAGTLPLVRVCGVLDLSTTATVNIITIYIQVCFGYFGVTAARALATLWSTRLKPSIGERVIAIWLCAFAPFLAWRLSLGHEPVLFGLLPLAALTSLVLMAHARQSGVLALAMGAFAIANGVSTFGAQMLIYSVLFGAPIAIAVLLLRPWTRQVAAALLACASGLLIVLPRLIVMVAYASSDDASRSFGGESLTYALGAARWSEWASSIPWARLGNESALVHEHNFPLGPLVALVVLLWPRGTSRTLGWALVASTVVAVLFASNVPPVADALLAAIPPLEAFRIPARAILPVLVFVPVLALAAVWSLAQPPVPNRRARLLVLLVLACAVGAIAVGERIPGWLRESVAWLACGALVVAIRWRHAWQPATRTPLLALIATLGVVAFAERVTRDVRTDSIEAGPTSLRAAVLSQAPELAMPLNRINIVDPPPPYRMSLAIAAGLSSLDADINPPRRFLVLLSELFGRPVSSASVVFQLGRSRAFPVLQQLYNVRYSVTLDADALVTLPEPPGAAWLPARVEILDGTSAIARAMAARPEALGDVGYVSREDRVSPPPNCQGHVAGVQTDALGQRALIDVNTTTPCTLVVATNFVSLLHAHSDGAALEVFPINIALTGIAVPAGERTVELAPRVRVHGLVRVAAIAGWLLLVAAGFLLWQRRE